MAELNLPAIVEAGSLPATLEVRQVLRELIDIQDDEYTMFDWLNFTGRSVSKPVENPEYFHFLNTSMYATAEVKADYTAQGVGVAASITLLGDAGVTPLVNELVTFPNGVQGLIRSVSDDTDPVIVVVPDAAVAIPSVADGDKLIFTSNAYAAGAGTSSVMRTTEMTKRSNYIQKFKTLFTEDDFSAGTAIELKFQGKNYIFYKQEYEAMRKHEMDIANQSFIGAKSKTMTDANGKAVYTTEGLRNAIINGSGVIHETAVSNTFDPLVDLKSMSVQMDANRCPSSYAMWASQAYDNAVDVGTATQAAFAGGGIKYTSYEGGDAIKIAMGTKNLTMFGYSFDKMRFQPSQHRGLYGAPGYESFLSEAYLIPNGKVKTLGANGAMVDRIRIRNMGLHGSFDNTGYKVIYTGGLAKMPTDNRDILEITYSSNKGLEFIGTEHFIKSNIKA